MNPLEMRARREALGLSQQAFGRLLGVEQASISRWEDGTRAPRDWASIDALLIKLEDQCEELTQDLLDMLDENDAPVVALYARDEDFWAACPERNGLPAAVHRVATARAMAICRAETNAPEDERRPQSGYFVFEG